MTTPISDRKAAQGTGCVRGFFLIFLLFGLGFGYAMFLRPVAKIIASRDWPAVPCTIVSSQVKAGSDGDTFRPEIRFAYVFDNRPYEGGRYSFATGSSSGRKGKQQIVARFRPGAKAICFLNPRNPAEAVLERGFVADLWWGLLPAFFCAVGILGFLFAGKLAPPMTVKNVAGLPPEAIVGSGENVVLRPTTSRWAKLLAVAIFALLWNGITWAVFGFSHPKAPIIFPIIFGGIGVLLIVGLVYQLLACLNPRPIMTVNRLALGRELRLEWVFAGRSRRIQRLRILLRGTEEATYRRGTDTTTDRHVFTELELTDTTEPADIATGHVTTTIPANSMHTFIAPNNKLLWTLHLHGEIGGWPDVDEAFGITVLPLPRST
ncbi:MAG TPA: DUF3592 domain-containing protein [Chthoniobacteraceae bacterium]|nr:DUF3592 domain-containing protein [Chthoniobacteraceae bacterium]